MKILGIDPGTNIVGCAVIETTRNQIKLISSEILKLPKNISNLEKLKYIFDFIQEKIKQFQPDEVAIEMPFFGKNAQSMLKLGRSQGVAIAAALNLNRPVTEYTPREIKLAITGYGNASKEQIARMINSILNINLTPKTFDQTDAIAIAITHAFKLKNKIK